MYCDPKLMQKQTVNYSSRFDQTLKIVSLLEAKPRKDAEKEPPRRMRKLNLPIAKAECLPEPIAIP